MNTMLQIWNLNKIYLKNYLIFKKLATMSKIQNKKELKIETNLINQNKIESKENLNINIENIKYKNNNIYNNDTILDLEKK